MRRLLVLLLAPLLLATACGGGSGSAAGSGSTAALPTVKGSYGDKPTISFPDGKPSSTLQKKVLKEGNGPVVNKGDLLVADYLGQVWKGKVFDNSYDRKQPAAFPIGVQKVIDGWDEGLVGVKSGSRVELVIPPDKGYGSGGNSQAGIKGTDTLVFVVDIVGAYGPKASADRNATPQDVPAGAPKVTGALGEAPKVQIPSGTTPPDKTKTIVLAKGTGKAVTPGLLVVQYVAVDWTGKVVQSTWQDGTPTGLPLSAGADADALKGVPLGSRVLLELPAQDASKAASQSTAIVLDLIAEPGTAKEAAAA